MATSLTPKEVEKLKAMYSEAEGSLVLFRKNFLEKEGGEVASPSFHHRWSDILLNGTGHFAVEAFRESSKTQLIVRSFPLHCLTFPNKSRDYIVLIKANKTLASSKLKEIEREYIANPALSRNLVNVIEESGEAFTVKVKDASGKKIEIRIEAYGKGSSVRGLSYGSRRPKIVLIDDPQDTTDAMSSTTLENDWQWFNSDILFLGKRTRIFLIGNNLGEKAIIERVFRYRDTMPFELEKIPIMVGDEASWPEMFSAEAILAEKEEYRERGLLSTWYRERMCEAIADETRMFRREDFRYYDPGDADKLANACNVYTRIDPSFSKGEHSDYTAIFTYGVDEDNNVFVFDITFGIWDADERIQQIFNVVARWRPVNVGIEKAGAHEILREAILKQQRSRNQFFNIVELTHGGKQKEQRIANVLQPRYKAHSMYHPQRAAWLAEYESELTMFSMEGAKTLRDDLIDAASYLDQYMNVPMGIGTSRRNRGRTLPRESAIITYVA